MPDAEQPDAEKGGYCHHHSNYTRTTANKAKMSLKVSAKGFRPDLENKTDQQKFGLDTKPKLHRETRFGVIIDTFDDSK